MKAIYGFNANVRKSDWNLIFRLAFDVENLFSMFGGKKHAVRKRIISQAFSPHAIQNLQQHIIKHSERLAQAINPSADSRDWSEAKDMSQWMGFVTLDIICDLCYSRNWNLIGSDKNRGLLQTFENGSGAISIVSYLSRLYHKQCTHSA